MTSDFAISQPRRPHRLRRCLSGALAAVAAHPLAFLAAWLPVAVVVAGALETPR